MGGGNAQKSKMARERNAEKNKGAKGNKRSPFLPTFAFFPQSMDQFASDSSTDISIEFLFLAGSQLEANKKAMNIQCKICMQTFICTTSEAKCKEHAEARHPKNDLHQCFPHLKN
ncbi:unnamed protein product [Urochloa decumbens]|uniref:At2g23090-like zinc-binding domain-containing protein n=1 Tax=Urochloa decumbens TaxID=240449 RepID=A0ABC9D9B1_9POAL